MRSQAPKDDWAFIPRSMGPESVFGPRMSSCYHPSGKTRKIREVFEEVCGNTAFLM